jgi:hypothetical protein
MAVVFRMDLAAPRHLRQMPCYVSLFAFVVLQLCACGDSGRMLPGGACGASASAVTTPENKAAGTTAQPPSAAGAPAQPLSDAGAPAQPLGDAGAVTQQPSADASLAPQDAGVDDASVTVAASCTGDLPVMKAREQVTRTDVEPDWTCYAADEIDAGLESAPGAASRTVTFRVGLSVSLMNETPAFEQQVTALIAGLTVDFFVGGSTLGTPFATRVFTGTSVQLDVPVGVTQVSAHFHGQENLLIAGESLAELHEYGFELPPSGAASSKGTILFRDSRRLTVSNATGGGMADPDKALLFALAQDCRGNDVSGAQFELVDTETGALVPTGTAAGVAHPSYEQFALPTTTCTFTTADQPAWLLIDAPVNIAGDASVHGYRVRVKGRMRASDAEPVIFGERDVELFGGSTTGLFSFRRVPR